MSNTSNTSNTKNIWLLTASNMPDCVATASFANVVFNHKIVLINHTTSIEDANIDILFPNRSSNDNLIIIGTFWKNNINFITAQFPMTVVYSFGDKMNGTGASVFIDTNKTGAIHWLTTMFSPNQEFMMYFDELIKMCNIRCFGQGNENVQILFSGVYAKSKNGNIYGVFNDLFTKKISMEQVCELGRIILDNNIQIVNERVCKNSKLIQHRLGTMSIAEGTEMINLTHDALRKKYNTDITVVFRYEFSFTGDKICYSVRTYDSTINALEILYGLENAGGSAMASGVQVSTIFQLPF